MVLREGLKVALFPLNYGWLPFSGLAVSKAPLLK